MNGLLNVGDLPSGSARLRAESRRALAVATMILVASLAAGCADEGVDDAASDESRRGGTLVVASPADLSVLNVFLASDQWTQEVNRYFLYTPLLRYTPELDYAPALAESWEATETSAAFRLRRDVRWHDGRPTTAHDVVYTIETARNPETAFPNASYFERWTSVEAVDSYTVLVRFEAYPEPLAGLPFTPIMPAHLLEGVAPGAMRTAEYNQRPVGNGPFRFVSSAPGERWIFEANPAYPESLGGPPYLDRVVWLVVPDNTAQTTALRTGEVDLVIGPRAPELRQLDAEPGIHAIVKPSRLYAFVAWNGQRPPLDDARVRRALSLAIDRPEILTVLRGGYGVLAAGPIAPVHWAYPEDVRPLPFSPDSARALLAAAGLTDRNGDGTVERPDGGRLEIEMKYPAQNPFNADVVEMIRADLAQVGVRVRPRATEFGTMIQDVMAPARNFDAVSGLAWETDFNLATLRDLFHSDALGSAYQSSSYSNAEVDSLIDRASRTLDREQARPMWRRVQEIMRDEQPWTFLFYYPELFAARDWLHTTELDVRGAFADIGDWWMDPAAHRRTAAGARDSIAAAAPDTAETAARDTADGAAPAP
ncbi:MAG TPA: ABC transporter substrate-binding protein [Longimicrobiales bacterium]|nr:ABC transporter substrate-binding protein [Longimicrobiales bacterium]